MEDKKLKEIIQQRIELDGIIKSQFTRKVTVMFTDIIGSTTVYDQKGDIDARVMLHIHNEITSSAIVRNRGMLVKEMGDGTMSVFDDPADSVKAAIEIQRNLRIYNNDRHDDEQIHVRIGLNYGEGIVEEKDVHGNVVIVASRIESIANADEILLTEDLYKAVKDNDELIFRYVDTVKLKGIEEPIKVFRVIWHEEELHLGKTRGIESFQKREGVFVLEASISGDKLKISGSEKSEGEERPVRSYKEIRFNEIKVKEYIRGVIDLLNRANRRGKIGNELLVKLKEYGGLLFDELIPIEIKEKLLKTDEKNLIINIDDKLVHIPWELLYDGKDFLCQKFSIGRSVSTKQPVSARPRAIGRPLKMQILADPRGDLKASYEEGVRIKDEIGDMNEWLNITLISTDVKTDYVKAKIRNFDIVHYAGHAEHNVSTPKESGWFLKDGKFSAEQIINMTGGMPMPSLVFSNACQTGQTDEWKLKEDYEHRIFGLANAFLLSGVQHYIGTFWEIPDEAGSHFAIHFYRNLIKGVTIGEAVRLSRHALIEKYGEDTIVWASYVLYGDPTTKYIVPDTEVRKQGSEQQMGKGIPVSSELRGIESTKPSLLEWTYKNLIFISIGLLFVAVIAIFLIKNQTTMVAVPVPTEKNISADNKDQSRKRIDELVASLSAKYREGKFEQPKVIQDEWSTRPLTMAFIDIKFPEGSKENNKERLIGLLTQSLQNENRITMIEREILVKLLEELSLGSSALADPSTSLKIGKLLSAKIIITGSIIPEKKGQTVSLRFIDTETTAVKKVISEEVPAGKIDRDVIGKIGSQILDWVKTDFLLRGRILSVTGDKCQINLGEIHGIKKGDRLEVLDEPRKGSGIYAVTGEIEINEVDKDKSMAVVLNKTGTIKEGVKVRGKLLKNR